MSTVNVVGLALFLIPVLFFELAVWSAALMGIMQRPRNFVPFVGILMGHLFIIGAILLSVEN